jgi:hypothetical protein
MLKSPNQIEKSDFRKTTEALEIHVQQRVAKVLTARDEFAAEPFFPSRHVACEILRLQSVPEWKKWAIYFERHGCVCYESDDRSIESTGLCTPCKHQVWQRLNSNLSGLLKGKSAEVVPENFE